MNGKLDLPDVHFGQVVPDEERDHGDDDEVDPDSEEYQEHVKETYKDLYDIDIDDLFDEDGNPKPDDEEDELTPSINTQLSQSSQHLYWQ